MKSGYGKLQICAAFAVVLLPIAAQASPFDPEAATQAYLSTLKGAARAKSDSYFEGGYWLILWGVLIAILTEWIILRTGLSARFRDWAERRTKRRFLQAMLWSVPYAIAGFLIALPWSIYRKFFREKQYDLLNQNFGSWFGDELTSQVISLIFVAILVGVFSWGIRRAPKNWWIGGTGVVALFVSFGMLIAPVFISPLFNTYTELKPGPTRDRIVAMAKANNVPSDHIYVFDNSRQTKRVSANVSGLGPTMRISLNDNLLNRTPLPEQAAVMGHELGHYVLGHVWKGAFMMSLLVGFALWLISKIVPGLVRRWGPQWGLRGPDDIAAIPAYMMALTAVMFLATPISHGIIRSSESEADAFGLDAAREPDGFANAALHLSEYRKMEPGALEEMLFYDHPSGRTRIRMAMDWKAKHLAETAPAPK